MFFALVGVLHTADDLGVVGIFPDAFKVTHKSRRPESHANTIIPDPVLGHLCPLSWQVHRPRPVALLALQAVPLQRPAHSQQWGGVVQTESALRSVSVCLVPVVLMEVTAVTSVVVSNLPSESGQF